MIARVTDHRKIISPSMLRPLSMLTSSPGHLSSILLSVTLQEQAVFSAVLHALATELVVNQSRNIAFS